jgi:Cu+-exporting ATPase
MKQLKLTIEGMHCASCATNIERALKKLKGVKSATVSLMTHKGLVEIDDNLEIEKIKNAVEKIGYNVLDAQLI